MAISFFQSLGASQAPVTVVDPDPNTTAPAATRVFEARRLDAGRGPRTLYLYATFIAGTTPSWDGQLYILDRTTGLWVTFGAALTGVNGLPQTVADVPAEAEVFFRVTTINGAPTSGIPHFYSA